MHIDRSASTFRLAPPVDAGRDRPRIKPAWRSLAHFVRELWLFAKGFVPARPKHRPRSARRAGPRVLVIPGLMADDRSMLPLRLALRARGYRAYRWRLGRNTGATADLLDRIDARVRHVQRADGEPAVLVGWSLGGLIAREYAKLSPDRVAAVVTLGSPFSGDISASFIARVYRWVAGHPVSALPIACTLAQKPAAPTVAVWSRGDGVIPASAARGQPAEADHAIEVACAHLALPRDALAQRAVVEAIEHCLDLGRDRAGCPRERRSRRPGVRSGPAREAAAAVPVPC